jgi:hypothetical protein
LQGRSGAAGIHFQFLFAVRTFEDEVHNQLTFVSGFGFLAAD